MTTEKQLDWIMGRIRALVEKYEPLLPMDEGQWQQFVAEVTHIDKMARGNKLMQKLLVGVSDYIDHEHRRLVKNGTGQAGTDRD